MKPTSPYKRSTRVASEVYAVIAEVCRNELSDPRLRDVQLTGAEMTDDLQIVKVHYYVEGSEDQKKKALKGLESACGYIKRAISQRIQLRIVPDIRFYFDEGVEEGEKLDKILDDLNEGCKLES
jgi:ribosome-binding factor A